MGIALEQFFCGNHVFHCRDDFGNARRDRNHLVQIPRTLVHSDHQFFADGLARSGHGRFAFDFFQRNKNVARLAYDFHLAYDVLHAVRLFDGERANRRIRLFDYRGEPRLGRERNPDFDESRNPRADAGNHKRIYDERHDVARRLCDYIFGERAWQHDASALCLFDDSLRRKPRDKRTFIRNRDRDLRDNDCPSKKHKKFRRVKIIGVK